MQKALVFGCLLLGSVLAQPTGVNKQGRSEIFSQKLDHLSDDARRFDMKYTVFDEFFQPGGPIFISLSWQPGRGMYRTLFEDLAIETKGYYVEMDYRLQQNRTDFDLKYITIEQILADFADLVQHLKTTVPGLSNSKVVMIGRYDRGSFAPWFRQKYPEHCDGAWAAEATVEARVAVEEFFESVGEMIKRHGSTECYDKIHNAFESIKNKFASSQASTLKAPFELCDDFKNSDDEKAFFTAIMALFSEFPRWSPRSIKAACEKMTDSSMDEVTAFSEMMKQFRANSPFSSCLPNTYEKILNHYQNKGKYEFYLMCNELGGFKTTTSFRQPFSANLNVEWYRKICTDAFGSGFSSSDIDKKVDDFNKQFGGKNPSITNAYYSIGEYSPFKSQAITQNLSDSVLAYVDKDEERAIIFQSITATGVSESLRQGQLRAMEQIRK